MMTTSYQAWTEQIRRLDRSLECLEPRAEALGVARPKSQQWYELLKQKLMAQLEVPPVLVVGVVGGTNIGKSVLFNQMAGEVASGVSPLAAGTRHPVCLVPKPLANPEILAHLFPAFTLQQWSSPEDPLSEASEHFLFWRVGKNVPDRLLLLDTPDVDSDVQVNWQRARSIRQSADLLIVVLTQQKYNDAAIKQFFREAVAAEKPILLVFNQVDLEADRPYWGHWLSTFCDETGARPESVYLLPIDRAAANEGRLPFYRIAVDGSGEPQRADGLGDDLSGLEFDAVKIRTFRGAMGQILDPVTGVESYLKAVRRSSGEFQAAVEALSAVEMARVSWPTLPAKILVDEIRVWWDDHRVQWSRKIHRFYRTLGQGMTWPIRAAYDAMNPTRVDPVESMRTRERGAILEAVEKLLDELDRLAQVGSETLRPRLKQLLQGQSRKQLLEKVREAHETLPTVDEDYRAYLRRELDDWKASNPRAVGVLHSLDHVAAVARPAITVSLAISGWVVAGDVVSQAAVQAAGHTASELAAEAAITGGITGGGEAIVSTTAEGVRQAAGRLFARLQSQYAKQRAGWLASWLEKELLGDLLVELRDGAGVTRSQAYRDLQQSLEMLLKMKG